MKNIHPIKNIQHIKTCNFNMQLHHSSFVSIVFGYSCHSDTFLLRMCVLWQEQREPRFLPVHFWSVSLSLSPSLPPSLSLSLSLSLSKVKILRLRLRGVLLYVDDCCLILCIPLKKKFDFGMGYCDSVTFCIFIVCRMLLKV